MLKTLVKKQLLELFRNYYINEKNGKARSKIGTILFFALLIILFVGVGFAFYAMALNLGNVILGHGFDWLYFALMGLLSMALGVFGSVFNTYADVYLPKDNEQLMSLPIPNRILLLSRLSGVYVTSLMYSAWIWIPVIIAYWNMKPVTMLNVTFPVILTFVIALFVSVLSCALGFVVAFIAARVKKSGFMTVVLSLMVGALYYVVYFKIVKSLVEIINHLDSISSVIRSWLHYFYLLGMAADGNIVPMLMITGITLLLAFLCVVLLSKTFTKLALAKGKTERKALKNKDYRQFAPRRALLRREYKHFTSVPTWMLNGGFGLLLLPICAVVLLIKSNRIQEMLYVMSEELPDLYSALPVLLLASVVFINSTNSITAVSVSIEGKSVWIMQTLPINTWEILRAKERMSLQLNIGPAIFFTLVGGGVFKFSWGVIVLECLAVWMYILMSTDFQLFLNLRNTNLNWTNTASLTKQSLSVVTSMFGGWVFCIVVGACGGFLCQIADASIVIIAHIALYFLFWAILRNWLKTKGTVMFETL